MSRKVLVVDDEKLIVKGVRFSLEQDGMEVDCAYDGEEAYNMAKEKEYDMILLDVMLPSISGTEVCRRIRSESMIPIIMLTALNGEEEQIKGLDLQVDDYITKPFNILEVKARIKAILRRMLPLYFFILTSFLFYLIQVVQEKSRRSGRRHRLSGNWTDRRYRFGVGRMFVPSLGQLVFFQINFVRDLLYRHDHVSFLNFS